MACRPLDCTHPLMLPKSLINLFFQARKAPVDSAASILEAHVRKTILISRSDRESGQVCVVFFVKSWQEKMSWRRQLRGQLFFLFFFLYVAFIIFLLLLLLALVFLTPACPQKNLSFFFLKLCIKEKKKKKEYFYILVSVIRSLDRNMQ